MIDQMIKISNKNEPSILEIIEFILSYTRKWTFDNKSGLPWYRGQSMDKEPIPSIFRDDYDEYRLNTTFRNRVAALKEIPDTKRLDMWLFLMQHYGCPTRLLDWTESLINALFFALNSYNELCDCKKDLNCINTDYSPTIWAIHPYKLNRYSHCENEFPNTWSDGNLGREYSRLGFHPVSEWESELNNLKNMKYPLAIEANHSDMRIFAQQSCFIIYGTDDKGLESIFEGTQLIANEYFLKFVIPKKHSERLLKELNDLGINQSKVFPDIEHFAKDLKARFKNS